MILIRAATARPQPGEDPRLGTGWTGTEVLLSPAADPARYAPPRSPPRTGNGCRPPADPARRADPTTTVAATEKETVMTATTTRTQTTPDEAAVDPTADVTLVWLDPAALIDHPRNVHDELGNLTGLTASIAELA